MRDERREERKSRWNNNGRRTARRTREHSQRAIHKPVVDHIQLIKRLLTTASVRRRGRGKEVEKRQTIEMNVRAKKSPRTKLRLCVLYVNGIMVLEIRLEQNVNKLIPMLLLIEEEQHRLYGREGRGRDDCVLSEKKKKKEEREVFVSFSSLFKVCTWTGDVLEEREGWSISYHARLE